MNKYRSHYCSELNLKNLNDEVILSGWVDTIRDHGNLLFIDLRDNYWRLNQSILKPLNFRKVLTK